MFPIPRILLPVVFSDRCRDAARYAGALGCRFGSELTLLHVVPPPYTAYGSSETAAYSSAIDITKERLEANKAMLDSFLADEFENLKVTRVVLDGDPAREIVKLAHEGQFSLIVMPTHGHGPFRRLLLGSVTAKVLHDAECPVLTGPHIQAAPVDTAVGFRTIVCALSLGPQSRSILQWAARAAEEFASHLAIVHVLPEATVRAGGFYFDPDWKVEMSKIARQEIVRLQDETGVSCQVVIEVGDVPDTVPRAVRELNGDLLVVGRGHDTGVLGRLRANAYAIIRESHCPVVSV